MTELAAMSVETARTVARDPYTVPAKLEELALHEDVEVRQAVASNPNTSSKVLFQLAEEFPDEFFNNPVFPLLSLENPDFYQSMPENTLRNLLVHESVPDGWLEWASDQTNIHLFGLLVENPVTSRAVLEKIKTYTYVYSIREAIYMHVNYGFEMLSGWHEFFKHQFQPWWENYGYYAKVEMLLLWEFAIIQESQFLQLPSNVKQNILKQTNSAQLIEITLANKPSKRLRLACARNLSTPTHYLIKLAYDNDKEVRENAMCNPNIPREVVEEYYHQHMVSNHPNSQSHELSQLISSKWWFIRANAAKHPNLSPDDLKQFLADSDFNVRASAAKNANISVEALEKLSKDKSVLVRYSVAQNSKTPIHCLEKLSCDRSEEVRASVASNSKILPELRASIKTSLNTISPQKYHVYKSYIFNYDITVNSATPLTELITIYMQTQNSDIQIHLEAIQNICQQLMCNQDITVELLAELLTKLFVLSPNINICTAIARHKNANNEICKRLIGFSSIKLRCSVAHNPNISIELLEKLLQDREADVRISALQAYQKRYANSDITSHFIIEWETATHPNTPPEKLAELVKSKWVLVREALAMHPRASEAFIVTKSKKAAPTVLEKLAKDTRQAVRIAVAENPNTPIEILEAIIKADKSNCKTSWIALKHLLERAPDRAEKHLLYYYEQMQTVDLSHLILQHPAAPISLLKKKLRLLSPLERYIITQNPKTSQEILEILDKDAHRAVRAAAKERLGNM